MRSVGVRFIVPFGLLTLAFSLLVVLWASWTSWQHATMLLERQAALALEFNLRIREYVSKEIRPRMEALRGKDGFDRETMSTSFVSRAIFEEVRKAFPDCVLRFSSANPRNPANAATAEELALIAYFQSHPEVPRRTEEITIGGKRHIAHFTPKWMFPECMRCHGAPEDAPSELVAQYGSEASFHRQVGEVAGLDTVAIPVDTVRTLFLVDIRRKALTLAGGLALLFASVIVLFRRAVTGRLVAMASHIGRIAVEGEADQLTPLPVSGHDAISVVGHAFNRLLRQLRSVQASLEERVEERTSALQRVNEELRAEIEERKEAERALRESELRFRGILDNLSEWAWMKDCEGRIIAANEQYARMVGCVSSEELIGKTDRDFWPAEDAEKYIRDDAEIVMTGEGKRVEERAVTREGVRWIETSKHALRDAGGTIIGTVGLSRDITDRKQAQEERMQAYSMLEAAMDQSAAGVMIADAPDGRIQLVNKAAEEILMMSWREQREVCLNNWKAITWTCYSSEGRVLGAEELPVPQSVLYGKVISNLELRVERHDGSSRWILVNSAPIHDAEGRIIGGVGVFPDITERKRVERALEESEARFRALFESMTEGVAVHELVYDAEGRPCNYRILEVNPAYSRHTGISAEAACGKLATEVYSMPVPPYLEAFGKVARTGAPASFELYFGPMGRHFTVSVFSPRPGWFATVFEDISERKRVEEERVRLEAQVQQAQKLESLGVLAGGIAHDFNNMLMAVLGNADLALQDLSEVSPARPMIEEIDRTAHRAADLCKQMLAYSGKGRFVIQPIDLSEVVHEMGHMLDVSVSKRAVLQYNLAQALPAVEADATQIRQVIMNLIINAAEAITGNNGVIVITTGCMECDDGYLRGGQGTDDPLEGRYVYIEVSDNGCGMDKEIVARIFDPFFTTKFTGRGLGLAAVIGIVRGHKGVLRVYSEPGKGTTFKILFPALTAVAERLEGAAQLPMEWQGEGVVLLVDDEAPIRLLGEKMLARLGFEVLCASDGRAALELFMAHAERIRCVLLDLTMPGMDGEETFRELRRIQAGVRVVMSSGYNEQEVVSRFAGKGLAGFIQKPYRMANLAAVLKEILGE